MAKFEASKSATRQEENASESIFTAYIDVKRGVADNTPGTPWREHISVHGIGKEGAEAFRDELLDSIEFTRRVKELLK